jgi:MraZ protein
MEEKLTGLFFGRYETTLDDKARINLPSRLRKMVPEGREAPLMLTPGSNRCIVIFTVDAYTDFWEKISDKESAEPAKVKLLQRLLGEKTVSIKLDKQGRFVLPQHLLQHAEITSDILIIGVQDRIELWNPGVYEEYIKASGMDFNMLSEQLGI